MATDNRFCSKCGAPLAVGASFCPSCGTTVGQPSSPTGQGAVSGIDALARDTGAQQYWFKRLLAFVVDAIIVTIVLVVIGIGLAVPVLLASGVAGIVSFFAGLFSVVAGLVLFLYFILAESSSGATFGKRAFGLKVVRSDGRYPTLGEAFVRNLSKVYWLLLFLDVVVGLATSKQYNQKFSDRLVGTSVVGR